MSVPEGTKPRWPLRPAGFALLAVALAAAATGLVLVVTDDGGDVAGGRGPSANQSPGSASARPSASQAPSPPPTASIPPAAPAPATPSAPTALPAPPPARPAPPAPAPAPPGQGGPGGPAALPPGYDSDVAGSGKANPRGAVRVYNNSTIRGLASRAANDLSSAGWSVVEVGNYSGGRIWTTTVYYQKGTGQRAAAEAIGADFGMRVEPRFAGIADASPGVIVIVTNDYGS